MKVSQVMTREVGSVHPDATLQRAALMMGELDTAMLPVCDRGRLVGVITDRDIAVRAAARGLSPLASLVGDVMSARVIWCTEDQDVDEVARCMDAERLSRLPVLGGGRQIVGIVSRRQLPSGGIAAGAGRRSFTDEPVAGAVDRQARPARATDVDVQAALGLVTREAAPQWTARRRFIEAGRR